jgi:hypothetical protein
VHVPGSKDTNTFFTSRDSVPRYIGGAILAGQIDRYLVRGSSCARVHLIGPWLFNCLSTILMLIKHKPTVVAGPGAGVSVSPELVVEEGASGNKEANGAPGYLTVYQPF